MWIGFEVGKLAVLGQIGKRRLLAVQEKEGENVAGEAIVFVVAVFAFVVVFVVLVPVA